MLALPPGSDVELLPLDDPQWDWKDFERFCLGFVKAQPGVRDARLYGTRGQDQRGIDIVADLEDGGTRTYQCRKWQAYRKADAEHTVEETEYEADEHVILAGCEVGTAVRDYIDGVESWSLLDKEDLSRAVREIEPRERARRLVEDTFSVAWRRAFLGPPGPLGFWETDDYFSALLDQASLFRHTWELVGRTEILRELAEQISKGQARVLVLVGRGGIGKTRILRSLADAQKASRTVLFADDNVPITAESVEELPWTQPIVIVDDAHRRDDLDPLIGSVRRNEGRPTLVLAIRPQRLDELRAELAVAGLGPDEVWISEPLDNLESEDVESLAREALGDHAHLAGHLAAATSDCPLVTVIGGQLLAQRAVPPELLESETDFRRTVLDRFRDEMLGRLGDEVDATAASEALVLVSALGPVMIDNAAIAKRMAEDLGVEPHALRSLLSQLEQAGLLIARGRLRRIVPDVLADHILHRVCVDAQDRPTGRADALLARYGDVALVALLRNLTELDWRIGLAQSEVTLLAAFWSDLRAQFIAANAEDRLRLIQLIKPVARLAPAPVFDIVRDAIDKPAETVTMALLGYEVTDLDVRQALPPLLGSIALTPRFLLDALTLLWQLARTDERPLNPHPEHAARVLGDLADYQLPIPYARGVLELAQRALEQDTHDEDQARSPLELLRPLLAREGTTLRDTGLEVQWGSYNVSAEGTAEIRAEVHTILVQEATTGSLNDRLLAAELLGDSLRQPSGFFGNAVGEKQRDQWHDDQLALLAAIEEVFTATDDPHVRFQLRGALKWHAEHSAWSDAREQAARIRERPMSETEELILALRDPIASLDIENSRAQLCEFAANLGGSAGNPAELAERLDAQVSMLDSLPGNVFVNSMLFVALAESDRALGAALAQWCADNPERPIARFGDSLLSVVSSGSHEEVRGILEGLRGGDSPARLQLASYLATGTWFGEPNGPEATMLRELVLDDEPAIVDTALLAVLRLAQEHPGLAIEIGAEAKIGNDPHLAEKLCMAVNQITDQFTDDQVRELLRKLRLVSRLDYWANRVLAGFAVEHREEVLEFLLDRVSEGNAHLSLEDSDADLLGGAEGEELLRLLRRVRDATVRANGSFEWQLAHLYWALASNIDASLAVLLEWLVDDYEERVEAALKLTTEMPWAATVNHPAFVEEALNAAHDRGVESLARVRDALFSATVIAGSHSRTLGQEPPRDVRLRDEGRACAERFALDSQSRTFFEAVAARAEANIAQAAVEDEEYPELP